MLLHMPLFIFQVVQNIFMFNIDWLIDWLEFNANFSNTSAISWRFMFKDLQTFDVG